MRRDELWNLRVGGYIEPLAPGYNILVRGSDKYINFETISGDTGYGFRDNSGTMQFKNVSGSWADIGSGGGGGAWGGITGTLSDQTDLQVVLDGKKIYHGIETNGALSFDNASHIITMASGTNTYWYKGTKYTTASAITCDIDSFETLTDNTLYYFYFDDGSGTLKCNKSGWSFTENVFVATVFWNGSAGALQYELHNHTRNIDWHIWAHDTIGTRYESGLNVTAPTTAVDGSLQIETGIIHDEDQEYTTGQMTTMRGWYLVNNSTSTFTDYALPYLGSAGAPVFLRTSDYSLQTFASTDFICYWVYASLDKDRPCYIIPTHATVAFNTLNLARANTAPVTVGINSEMKLIYKFIYAGNGDFQEMVDYRTSSSLPGGGISAISAGSVSFVPTGNIVATNVQSALAEVDAEKLPLAGGIMTGDILMTSNKIVGGSTTTSDLVLQTTTGVGAAGADMHFKVGNNGATEAMTILNDGKLEIGGASSGALVSIGGDTFSPNQSYHYWGSYNGKAYVGTDANSNVILAAATTKNVSLKVNNTTGLVALETDVYLYLKTTCFSSLSVTTDIIGDRSMFLKEAANGQADIAGYGQLWVKSDTPCNLYYSDDTGVKYKLNNFYGGLMGMRELAMTGDITLTADTDTIYQLLDPNGSTRIVTLATGATVGSIFIIKQSGSFQDVQSLTLKQGTTTMDRLYAGGVKKYIFNGSDWLGMEVGTGDADTANDLWENVSWGSEATGYAYGTGIGNTAKGHDRGVAIGRNSNGSTYGQSIGFGSVATSYGSALGAFANTNSKARSVALGYYSETERTSEISHNIDAQTDQENNLVWGGWAADTTNDTPAVIPCGGTAGQYFIVRASSVLAFEILVTGRDNTTGDCAVYHFIGGIKRDASNATALVGSVTKTVVAEDDASWDCDVTADDTNECVQITVTGDASNTVQWAAKLSGVETHF